MKNIKNRHSNKVKTFKDVAYEILREEDRPLNYRAITDEAIKRGWLNTAGDTPWLMMHRDIVGDINRFGKKSRFNKEKIPGTFTYNKNYIKQQEPNKAFKGLSKTRKGDIAESRIAELITLYGAGDLFCYKPQTDDEGIDLAVKQKDKPGILYLQIKSLFHTEASKAFYHNVKERKLKQDCKNRAIIFCRFAPDSNELVDVGDIWFIPYNEFVKNKKLVTKSNNLLLFKVNDKNRTSWDKYIVQGQYLADRIIEYM